MTVEMHISKTNRASLFGVSSEHNTEYNFVLSNLVWLCRVMDFFVNMTLGN